MCVGNTFFCTACWGGWRRDAASVYCVVEQRTGRGKLTRHNTAPGRSYRPVSTTVELLMLRNSLCAYGLSLCTPLINTWMLFSVMRTDQGALPWEHAPGPPVNMSWVSCLECRLHLCLLFTERDLGGVRLYLSQELIQTILMEFCHLFLIVWLCLK